MSDRTMRIVFSSGLVNLIERNSSFDSGVLRVAYTGRNRNNSFISKETFELCIPTIYNCPIVCRYDRATDSIGKHDVELLRGDDGGIRLINITQPVGVIPESAKYWWEEIEDESGLHEYLCVEALIWKRQEAYRKIKEDGITDESMEITVREGSMIDGVYVIKRFEFTAFCLLGSAEPCFESASLEMFSREDFQQQLAEMMKDFKESFSTISTPFGVTDKTKILPKGGERVLEKKMELLAKYGLAADDMDIDMESITYEELEEKLHKQFDGDEPEQEPSEDIDPSDEGNDSNGEDSAADDDGSANETVDDENEDVEDDGDDDGSASQSTTKKPDANFALAEQFKEELLVALSSEIVETSFGEMSRYLYVDYNPESCEVFCYDMEDWNLYGFSYSMNGDNVVIDFQTKARKKFDIVDFDQGDQIAAFSTVFTTACEKYQEANQMIASMSAELSDLRKFKNDTESAGVFARFEDLIGLDAFEDLRSNCDGMDAETLEEKCYAIRGKYGSVNKFSLEETQKPPKLMIGQTKVSNEPYNGLFSEYGIEQKN